MALSKEFDYLVLKLIHQKQDELSRKQSQRQDEILKKYARNGWTIPPGSEHEEFDDLQVDSIRRRDDMVWSSLKKALKAFDPPYSSELATQLHSLAESFFPLSLCEPHGVLRRMGWKHPMEEEANLQLISRLEGARVSSLRAVSTNIDLYVAKKRSKFNSGEPSPSDTAPQKNGDLSICHPSEDKVGLADSQSPGPNQKMNNAVPDQTDTYRTLLIDFAKTVLNKYPMAKTADLRRNCFEGMDDLNSRESKIINDLLVTSGVKKSKKGEHAVIFEWESKYPKAHWMRVFKRIK